MYRSDTQARDAGERRAPAGSVAAAMFADDVVAMLDRLTDGIVVLGPDWRYRYVNEPAAAMLGRTPGTLIGRHIWTEFPDGVGQPFHLAYERAMHDQQPTQIVEYYAPFDRWFENRMFPQGDNLVIVFQDVTERQRAEAELREYADRMTTAEQIASFGVWKWELDSGRVLWSEELHRIYGVRPGRFGGTVDAFVARVHPDDRERVWTRVCRAIETLEPFVFEERIVRDDGEERQLLSQGRIITNVDAQPAAVVGICHDITERHRAKQALGLSERRIRAIIDNTPSIVVVKDLEGRYLMANSEIGRVLDTTPEALIGTECVTLFPPDLAARLRSNDHRAVTERRPVYDEAVLIRDGEPRTYVTVTFALPDDDGVPVETCTIGTDVTDNRERENERRDRLEWTRRIETALREERLLVYAQPIVDVATGHHVSCELLVRMLGEDGAQVISPGAFLPAAERFGLIQQIDVWMVGKALRLARSCNPHVNLSALTICDPAATRAIVDLLASDPDAARKLVFEITETAAVEHLEAAIAFANEISALGRGVALDDFGTGFGSFTYLRKLPLRSLKIDMTFVAGVRGSEGDRRIVRSIIGIAEQFGLQLIVEGVEDAATLELLRGMGVAFVQGFHLGRPARVKP
jgi:PAS domain S-box-containing protein